MFRYFTIDDFNLKDKLVGVRVDINSPIINNKISFNERMKSHLETIFDLQKKGAKIVVLAHQGRKGEKDYTSLKLHYELLKDKIKNLYFIDEVYSKKVINVFEKLKGSEVLMLENLRSLDDEVMPKKKSNKIKKLIEYFDFYVLDAFSVAHREHSSIIFSKKVPVLAGKVMEKELKGLSKILSFKKRPYYYLFGGAKPDDLIILIEKGLKEKEVDLVLTSGVIGEIFLYVKGYNIGKKLDFLKEKGYLKLLNKIKELYNKYSNKIITPLDVALFDGKERIEIPLLELNNNDLINKFPIQDIGKRTLILYKKFLKNASTIYFKGPAGNFEIKEFQLGTKELVSYLGTLKSFRFLGGGHSLEAVNLFSDINKFDYVSLAGGALVHFLKGDILPGIVNLEESFNKFEKEVYDFLVVGSNVVDYRINTGLSYKEIHLGDKVKVPENFSVSIGGGGTNVSVALSRLGGKVLYLGKFSEETKDLIIKDLKRNNIEVIRSKISKTAGSKSIVIDYKEDRVIYSYRGQNNKLSINDFKLDDYKFKYAYFSSLGEISFGTLIKLAINLKKKNIKICFNPSLYLIKNEKVMNLVKLVDILILNYEEASELTGNDKIDDIINFLLKYVDVIVVTDGKDGAYGYDKENKLIFQEAFKTKVVDSTGAGDAFASTFYYFYINGYGLKKSLELASKNAANVVKYKNTKMGLMYYDTLIGNRNE